MSSNGNKGYERYERSNEIFYWVKNDLMDRLHVNTFQDVVSVIEDEFKDKEELFYAVYCYGFLDMKDKMGKEWGRVNERFRRYL